MARPRERFRQSLSPGVLRGSLYDPLRREWVKDELGLLSVLDGGKKEPRAAGCTLADAPERDAPFPARAHSGSCWLRWAPSNRMVIDRGWARSGSVIGHFPW